CSGDQSEQHRCAKDVECPHADHLDHRPSAAIVVAAARDGKYAAPSYRNRLERNQSVDGGIHESATSCDCGVRSGPGGNGPAGGAGGWDIVSAGGGPVSGGNPDGA